jgi:predicted translation initiation factor SUI1
MARPQRVVLFVAADATKAENAAAAFSTAAGRLGLPWSVRSSGVPVTIVPDGLALAVAVDLPDLALPDWRGRVEGLTTAPDLDDAVNRLLARLLGGNDQAAVPPPTVPSPPKKAHTVKVSRETAGRKGKGVTVVSELPLSEEQLKELATKLKNACGSGGTAKDGRIEIQGDHRDRLVSELEKLGYKVKRAGG